MNNVTTIVKSISSSINSRSRFGLTYDEDTGLTRRFENVDANTDVIDTFKSFPEAVYSIVDILEAENPDTFELAELVDIDDLVMMEVIFDHVEAA